MGGAMDSETVDSGAADSGTVDSGTTAHRFAVKPKATPRPVLVAFIIVVTVKLDVLTFGPALQNDTLGDEPMPTRS